MTDIDFRELAETMELTERELEGLFMTALRGETMRLTPTQAARALRLERRDVIAKCVELGVPISDGRLDVRLLREALAGDPTPMEIEGVRADTYWCSWRLRNPSRRLCGYVQRGPGHCPYDHGENVPLIPLFAAKRPHDNPTESESAC